MIPLVVKGGVLETIDLTSYIDSWAPARSSIETPALKEAVSSLSLRVSSAPTLVPHTFRHHIPTWSTGLADTSDNNNMMVIEDVFNEQQSSCLSDGAQCWHGH